ncbi:4Fe-4S ferredoxin [candidate division LCP-89 bacterium B3_LCP]|uniref:4Fe-4S ferredoxin n=1 Tax=candidate division LCP-89 bacterium B3_LCP TaxID=2012998 RepID=A0A532V347_UNCL8|nr:MAG: 4Fe-4S ferredoxin [candidate division LCP-89 bacterium B3_LCP]
MFVTIVGKPERFDERDCVFSRHDLKAGTEEYSDFYQRHPEWKEADDDIRARLKLGLYASDADKALLYAPDWLARNLGRPEMVDGSPASRTVDISPERAVRKIKALAKNLGADLVGISRLNPAYIYSHRGRMNNPEEEWGSPIVLKHQFAISLGFRQNIEMIRTAPGIPEMSETLRVYAFSAHVAVILAAYMRMLGYRARAHHFRNYQVLPVPLAVEAGLGELGRCGFLLTREYGNCLRLATVTTDLPLICDTPVDIGVHDFCTMCKLCAEACPSGSIPTGGKIRSRGADKWQIDELKCYRYWSKVGTDCGICIASCPWSQPDNWMHITAARLATQSHFARVILLWLHPLIYGRYKPREKPEWFDERARGK